MSDIMSEAGRLADNLVHFTRGLRRAGIKVGPGALLDATAALLLIGIENRGDVHAALRATLIKRHEDFLLFDQAFDLFWRKQDLAAKMMAALSPIAPIVPDKKEKKAGSARLDAAFTPARPSPLSAQSEKIAMAARLTASDRESLRVKDFAQMSAEEILDAKRAIRTLVLPDDRVKTRRAIAAPRPARIDFRRTVKRALKTGGAAFPLLYRHGRLRHPPVVALLDISGSMSDYSRLFLHFLHSLSERRKVFTFLFGTRLTHVSRALARKDPDAAFAACAAAVPDWEGGTRIGEALFHFNRKWLRRTTAGGPVVLLITDGLEREDTLLLAAEAERLRRSCRRLIWLNPLLRFEGFEPRAAGIRTLLAHVDEFRPLHSLEAVTALCHALSEKPRRSLSSAPM